MQHNGITGMVIKLYKRARVGTVIAFNPHIRRDAKAKEEWTDDYRKFQPGVGRRN